MDGEVTVRPALRGALFRRWLNVQERTYSPTAQRKKWHSPRNKMPSRKPKLQVYVAPEELEQIIAKAQSTRLSVSEFAKRACLGRRIKSKVEAEAILALVKVNADMGRLGGLLKLWLSEPERGDRSIVRKLLHDIEDTRTIIQSKIQSL